MSGHSHWSKIKRAKGDNDAKRGKEWSKLAKRIIITAKAGGGNPDENLSLRYAIDDAKAANMTKDTIQNAVKKGTGELAAVEYERLMYEGYGPGGVAIMVECLTDNRHRTAPEMRKLFERGGGQLGATNCVAWMFAQKGTFSIPVAAIEEEKLMDLCLGAGAEDMVRESDTYEVTCEPAAFGGLREALTKAGIEILSAEIGMVPNTTVTVTGEKAQQIIHLLEALDENEDVQNVYANFFIPDEAKK
jgi:YebC/PmpR family DNA-binding regulatory protein